MRISSRSQALIGLFAFVACALFSALPIASLAQQATKVARIGYLQMASCEGFRGSTSVSTSVLKALQELGYSEGTTVRIECRSGDGHPERMPEAAAELVRQKPDIIVAVTNVAAFPAKQATSTIPIVVWGAHGALETGLVPSLSHQGGNVTGGESLAPEVDAKRLELLKEIVPKLANLTVLYNPEDQGSPVHLKHTRAAGRALSIAISTLEVRHAADFDIVLQGAAERLPDAILIYTDWLTFPNAKRVADFALAHRVPLICEFREMASAGCLIYYGPTLAELGQITARQIDRILRGAKPADLPVEQATRYELVVNLKTARALGITIPQTLLIRADAVIE